MMRYLENQGGFALILTLLVIAIIVAMTLQFNTTMRSGLDGAENLSDTVKLGSIAKSGFECAAALLFKDASNTDYDSLHENWAKAKSLSLGSSAFFEEGRFMVEIVDVSGKIQINNLVDQDGAYRPEQKALLTGFLSSQQFGLDYETVEDIIDAIKDWIDADNEVTKFGAEDAYYQSLEKPYHCKNAPIESLEELLFVRGISLELFSGTKEKAGISRYLTVYGDGKVNLNTADPIILRSLSAQIDQETVEDMIAYRNDEDNDLKDPTWYRKVPGMGHVTIDPKLLTTVSTHFMIASEGRKGDMRKRVEGTIERKSGAIRLLSWKVF
jgi:general secretion pathway protein K